MSPYLAPFLRYTEILIKKHRCEPTPPLFDPPLGVMSLHFRRHFGISKLESVGIVSVILGLAIFVQLRLVTDGRTDTR